VNFLKVFNFLCDLLEVEMAFWGFLGDEPFLLSLETTFELGAPKV
jgi:hypothetical protein